MLSLNFEICQVNACKDLVFSETTGPYDSVYNTTGYGTPNIELADMESAILTITDPTGTISTIDLTPQGFPTDDLIADGYTITSTTPLADGQWTFIYTVTPSLLGSEPYTKTISKLFYCNADCCVEKMLTKVEVCDCCNDNTDLNNYVKVSTFLSSLKKAASCGDVTSFSSILKIVNKLCKNSGCKTC
jgi:hypothetical protein